MLGAGGLSSVVRPDSWIARWGYVALFLGIFGGNVGLPVPEETMLVVAGYFAWRGTLRLSAVLAVGLVGATAGDNVGYWLGRRYGAEAIARYGRSLGLTAARLETMRRFVGRYGAVGVFLARFLPGLRFAAGPLAGAVGLRLSRFVVANLLGALCYVPLAVGLGYAIGLGFGPYLERIGRVVGEVERALLLVVLVATLGALAIRIARSRQARREP
jgi:membrane protein DedA with SNARE-associated domain